MVTKTTSQGKVGLHCNRLQRGMLASMIIISKIPLPEVNLTTYIERHEFEAIAAQLLNFKDKVTVERLSSRVVHSFQGLSYP